MKVMPACQGLAACRAILGDQELVISRASRVPLAKRASPVYEASEGHEDKLVIRVNSRFQAAAVVAFAVSRDSRDPRVLLAALENPDEKVDEAIKVSAVQVVFQADNVKRRKHVALVAHVAELGCQVNGVLLVTLASQAQSAISAHGVMMAKMVMPAMVAHQVVVVSQVHKVSMAPTLRSQ